VSLIGQLCASSVSEIIAEGNGIVKLLAFIGAKDDAIITLTKTCLERNERTPVSKPTIYTISTCPACNKLKQDWTNQGIGFEERQVDDNQAWLDEALKYGDMVPIVVYDDGRVQIGYANMIG